MTSKNFLNKWEKYRDEICKRNSERFIEVREALLVSFLDENDGYRKFKDKDGVIVTIAPDIQYEKPSFEGFMEYLSETNKSIKLKK